MANGLLYEFCHTSANGAEILITIHKKDYTGEVKKRALGRAPVIRRENNDHIYGTSCEIYAECLVDGEFSSLYTSDAKEYCVYVYKNDNLIWNGFVSPELYSEPDIAPPYDVQIIATDGLGELKNYSFVERGPVALLVHLNDLTARSGIVLPFDIVSGLRYVQEDGTISDENKILSAKLNLDHEVGNSCYDVLQNLLSSLNAGITQHNGRYLIFRETDFISKATENGVNAYDINGVERILPVATFGSMTDYQWWPVGQLSTVINPAKKDVTLKSPNYYKNNILDFEGWTTYHSAAYDQSEGAYFLPSANSFITQTINFGEEVGYRLGLRIRARNIAESSSGEDPQSVGVKIKINGRAMVSYLGDTFWLTKSQGASSGSVFSDYIWAASERTIEEDLGIPLISSNDNDAKNIDIVLPLFDKGDGDGDGTYGSYAYANSVEITISNTKGLYGIYVYEVSLVKYEQFGGYEVIANINNAARDSEPEIDLAVSAGEYTPAAGRIFMNGILLQPSGTQVITQWKVGDNEAQGYLPAMALDYSRAVALPKMKYTGVLNVPASSSYLPLLFLRDNTYYFPRTYSYDLYNDEINLEMVSISAADVTLDSVVITEVAQSSNNIEGGVTTSSTAGGGMISIPRDSEMSDTSTNAVENKVIKAYVDALAQRVKAEEDVTATYEEWWSALKAKVVVENGNVKISTNLIVTGDTSSGGEGGDTPAEGTVTGVTVGSTNYTDVNAGLLDLTSLMSLYTPLTSHNALATRVSTLEGGSATAISVTGSGNVISGVSKSGTTITFTKGVTALTGITKAMIATALEASQGGRYLIDTGGALGWSTAPTKLSQFTDDVVAGNYLPLSGGTIDGNLVIGKADNTAYKYLMLIRSGHGVRINNTDTQAYLTFGAVDSSGYMTAEKVLLMGDNGLQYSPDNATYYTLIHSGNIGSYAVKIDGSSVMIGETGLKWDNSGNGNSDSFASALFVGLDTISSSSLATSKRQYSAVLNVGGAYISGYRFQLASYAGTNNELYYRGYDNNNSKWKDWKTIAFTDSNVASATKLETARTIWGQSFDGTGNVSGNLYLGSGWMYVDNSSDISNPIIIQDTTGVCFGYGNIANNLNTYVDGNTIRFRTSGYTTRMLLNSSGNVTIGASDLASTTAKLYVHGITKIVSNANNLKLYTLVKECNVQVGRTTSAYTGGYNCGFQIGEDDTMLAYIAGAFNGSVGASGIKFFYGGTKTEDASIVINGLGGNVGIGTTSPSAKLEVLQPADPLEGKIVAQFLSYSTSPYGIVLRGYASGTHSIQVERKNTSTEFFPLSLQPLGGYVGIGTTSPSYKLDVNGTVKATEYKSMYSSIQWTFGGGVLTDKDTNWVLTNNATYQPYIVVDSENVRVGIATKTPAYTLDVGGTGRFTGAVTMSSTLSVTTSVTSTRFFTSGGYGLWKGSAFSVVYTDNDIALYASTIGIEGNVRPHNNNKFTFGTSSYQWSTIYGVNGIFSGDTSSGSDIRFKDRIEDMAISISDIANAPLFTFKWNDREDDTIHLGSSAQYWERITPQLVSGQDFKSLNYATLGVAMGISLAKKSINHEARIKALEKENNELREKIRRIEYGC